MPKIEFLSDAKSIEIEEGESILQASLRAGIPHTHVCGGKARCTTCRILLIDGDENRLSPPGDEEYELVKKLGFAPNIRLACQSYVRDDIKIRRLVIDDNDIDLAMLKRSDDTGKFSSTGVETRVAILFTDIRDFTSFSDNQLPYDIIHMLNRYICQMRLIIERNNGEVFNYMGDGLMALFGVEKESWAIENAVRSGMEMLEAMDNMQPYLQETYGQGLQMGVGIHCGDVVIGSFEDSSNAMKMVIGDAVNFASRVESANKETGTKLLVSQTVFDRLKEKIQIGKTCSVELKGKSGEHQLYEVLSISD
ncbi:MAG: adenylate/guanylate cyclase domain-containing protein [Gammaproteobacteria bacterium]|jgi:adenylate cyclase|nr:adenylate/guanylate cyclase domain-containing protein [Gammaproteobacteria bacterium]